MPHCKKKVTDIPVLSRDVTTFLQCMAYAISPIFLNASVISMESFIRLWLVQHVEASSKYCEDAENAPLLHDVAL
jgi:hypothetical protein